jgi:hypothetical protein
LPYEKPQGNGDHPNSWKTKPFPADANPRIRFESIFGDFLRPDVAQRFLDCDYLFLAADPMPVRLLFNAVVHQYLIPGVQLGSKVLVNQETGELLDAYSVSRPVSPDRGCLWCTGFIPPGRQQDDAQGADERYRQRYVDDPDVIAPSVITLNATAAARAADDFLFTAAGLTFDHAPRDYYGSAHVSVRFSSRNPAPMTIALSVAGTPRVAARAVISGDDSPRAGSQRVGPERSPRLRGVAARSTTGRSRCASGR